MEDLIKLYDLIEYERECLRNWKTRQDLSLMPTGWSVTSQQRYVNDLYEEYYEMSTKVFKDKLYK